MSVSITRTYRPVQAHDTKCIAIMIEALVVTYSNRADIQFFVIERSP